jgi:hypothetical protein
VERVMEGTFGELWDKTLRFVSHPIDQSHCSGEGPTPPAITTTNHHI